MQATTLQDFQKQASRLAQLLTFSDVCSLLRKSRSGVYKLMASDPTFPRAIKNGETRSARAFFVSEEIAKWMQAKIEARSFSK